MAAKKVAGLVTDILYPVGVRRIYGVVGDSLDGINKCQSNRRGGLAFGPCRGEKGAKCTL
jgi:pyruvate dehydrogenase (quinone)